ncbi:hypothetical protein ACIN5110_1561 [Acinetobacter baumannii OIFC110]|nr:hypothetical protein ACIN5110_1561 [Acinetobacter baumannii OIFC110]
MLEYPIKADFALIKATRATAGAIWFTVIARNFGRSWPWLLMSPLPGF